jgi:hypothetical protein
MQLDVSPAFLPSCYCGVLAASDALGVFSYPKIWQLDRMTMSSNLKTFEETNLTTCQLAGNDGYIMLMICEQVLVQQDLSWSGSAQVVEKKPKLNSNCTMQAPLISHESMVKL